MAGRTNLIQIRTGQTKPGPGVLKPGELGFAYGNENKLYIGNPDEAGEPLSAGGGVSAADGVAFVDEADPNSQTALVNAESFGGVPFDQFFDDTLKNENRVASAKKIGEIQSQLEGKIDAQKVSFNDIHLPIEAFIDYTGNENYPFQGNIVLEGVLATMTPEVYFNLNDATSGIFSPIAESYDGGVYIYATEKPAQEIIIPNIILWR